MHLIVISRISLLAPQPSLLYLGFHHLLPRQLHHEIAIDSLSYVSPYAKYTDLTLMHMGPAFMELTFLFFFQEKHKVNNQLHDSLLIKMMTNATRAV